MSKAYAVVFAFVFSVMTSVTVLADTFKDTGMLMLVNSSHRIEKDYTPEMVNYKDTSFYLAEEAAASLARMLSDMEKELGSAPMIARTYRSYERQDEVYNRDVNSAVERGIDIADAIKGTSRYIALPGASEHQTALAVDLTNDGSLEENFIESEAGQWIEKYCHSYGFVVRYPKSKEEYTKVGQPYSDIMYEKDWCLEEL